MRNNISIIVAAILSGLLQWALMTAFRSHFPLMNRSLVGMDLYVSVAPFLAGFLAQLVAIAGLPPDVRPAWLTPSFVAALCASPALVAIVIMTGVGGITSEYFSFLPALGTVSALLAIISRGFTPVVAMLLAVPGPLITLAFTVRERWATGLAAAGSAIALSAAFLQAGRAEQLRALSAALSDGRWDVIAGLDTSHIEGLAVGLLVSLTLCGVLLWRRRVLAAFLWLPVGLVLLDPATLILDYLLMPIRPAQEVSLPRLGGPGLTARGMLIDLTSGQLHLNGEPVNLDELEVRLTSFGHPPSGVPASNLREAWRDILRERALLAVPADAAVDEVLPVLKRLKYHGVQLAMFLGQPPGDTGDLQSIRRWPAIPVFLDEPQVNSGLVPTARTWIRLDDEEATVDDFDERCQGTYPTGSGDLGPLQNALAPCWEGVVIIASPGMSYARLFAVIDALGGSGEAPFRESIGLSLEDDRRTYAVDD